MTAPGLAPVPDGDDLTTRRHEIERLRAQIAEVDATWGGCTRFPDEAQRLEERILARRLSAASLGVRLDGARRRLVELEAEERNMMSEIVGLERGLEALLRRLLEETVAVSTPMWSPIPVHGYRMWWLTQEGLQGATGFVWRRPYLTARCGGIDGTDDGEVPHIDGRCGAPACGIYALKEAATLLRFSITRSEEAAGQFIGLTALSGRVVEHDHGYRAQHGRVVAAALIRRDGILVADDPAWLEQVFREPIGTIGGSGYRPATYPEVIEFFETVQQREEQQWTSGSSSE